MEIVREKQQASKVRVPRRRPTNDNRHKVLSTGRSIFPDDAVARIFKPSRSAMTSGKAGMKGWQLVFERRSAPFIEPLMGYTGGNDTLAQVALQFPTLAAAIRYAKRQGLAYVVREPKDHEVGRTVRQKKSSSHAFSDATLERLGLVALQESYGSALDGAANRNDPSGPASWNSPMDVVSDTALSLAAKRSILMNWAWTEYLIDQATNEGMPENNRPSGLHEVEQALLALEREVESGRDHPMADRKAA